LYTKSAEHGSDQWRDGWWRSGWLSAFARSRRVSSPRRPRYRSVASAIGLFLLFGGALALLAVYVDSWIIAEVRRFPGEYTNLFEVITDYGRSGWLLFPLLAAQPVLFAACLLAPPGRDRLVVRSIWIRLWFLLSAIAIPGLFTSVGKHLIGRARPYVSGGDAHLFVPLAWRSEYASLPSGHSTTAFAAALAIGAVWPRSRALVWGYALVIGASRIIVTAHFPSDVIASAAVGVIGALLVRNHFAGHRRIFFVGTDGAIHPFPGPSLSTATRAMASVFRRLLHRPPTRPEGSTR
jgi:membrane-associated phospholipid phosphatase